MRVFKLPAEKTSNPKSCFFQCPVVLRQRQDLRLAGVNGITAAQTFVLPQQKRIFVLDPSGHDAAGAMWNMLTAMMKASNHNRLVLSQLAGNVPETMESASQEKLADFAAPYGADVEFLELSFPLGEANPLFQQNLAKVSAQLKVLEPDVICLPYFKWIDNLQHELYLKAIARMIVSHIETCKEAGLINILGKKLTLLFYENYDYFSEGGVKPNLYYIISPRDSDLRRNYKLLYEASDKRIFAAMRRNVMSDANEELWNILQKNPSDFYFERFVECEIEVVQEEEFAVEMSAEAQPFVAEEEGLLDGISSDYLIALADDNDGSNDD